jgi:fructose-1,6-bisphosphatase I
VSEEVDAEIAFNAGGRLGVFFDPLDGSSNLDVNVTVGSIFSVVAATGAHEVLQPGRRQLAAGFAGYGPATTLVITFGRTVAGFVLSPDGFALTAADIKVPEGNLEFAINTSRERYWDAGIRSYIASAVAGEGGKYNMRWVGSMVAEIQRILNRGGIFLYPADSETRAKGGRLRLLYEANPMALIIETAGGGSSEGSKSILDIEPTGIHQRVPVIVGAASEVRKVEAAVRAAG